VSESPSVKTYAVKQGDSLWRIAKAHGTDVVVLARLNRLVDPDALYVGQVLEVPAGPEGPPRATAVALRDGQVEATVDGVPRLLGPGEAEPAPLLATDGRYVVWAARSSDGAPQLCVWDANTARSRTMLVDAEVVVALHVQPTSAQQTALIVEARSGELPLVAVYSPAIGFAWAADQAAIVEALHDDQLTLHYPGVAAEEDDPFAAEDTETFDLRELLRA
jgi:LysM repeat protein